MSRQLPGGVAAPSEVVGGRFCLPVKDDSGASAQDNLEQARREACMRPLKVTDRNRGRRLYLNPPNLPIESQLAIPNPANRFGTHETVSLPGK